MTDEPQAPGIVHAVVPSDADAPLELALARTHTPPSPALDRTLTPLPLELDRTRTPAPDDPRPEDPASPLLAPTLLSNGDGASRAALPPPDDEERRAKLLLKGRLFRGKATPVKIGRFTILDRLGEGGMGVVYTAYDDQLDRKIAVKVLRGEVTRRDDSGRTRLLREAQAMARLSHPNIVTVHEVGALEDQIYIAMEFVRGLSLDAWLKQNQVKPWREVLDTFIKAGRGLEAAHRAGIIHRDFKPKYRRLSQTAPQPTDRPHSHSQGRFERVDVYRAAPGRSGVPQVLAKRWQRTGPPEDQRGLAPRHSQGRHHEPFPSHPFATAAPRAAAGR